jgi:hypothetical protein
VFSSLKFPNQNVLRVFHLPMHSTFSTHFTFLDLITLILLGCAPIIILIKELLPPVNVAAASNIILTSLSRLHSLVFKHTDTFFTAV